MFTEIASKTTVKPNAVYRGLPTAADRAAWIALPDDLKAALVAEGENYLGYAYPQILATDYMEFTRTGNRVHYEDKQFARRTALDALVLAECVEYKGRFLDDIVNGIFLICEESGWQLPAHNSADGSQMPLPDVTRPVIDLFAAETAAVLGVAEYLLRDALAEVSPAIPALINENLRRRIFAPYLTDYFWWMGDGTRQMNNWTPWCTQNILLAAFTRKEADLTGEKADLTRKEADLSRENADLTRKEAELTKEKIASPKGNTATENTSPASSLPPDWKDRVFRQACVSLDYFLADYEEDGCCDEGAQYFSHAALTLFESLEVLNDITGGLFGSAYQEPKIRNMAAYILNVHVAGPYYINFADCSPLAGRRGVREYLFGKRTGNPALTAFAAQDYAESDIREKLASEEHNLFYRAQSAFRHQEMMAFAVSRAPAISLPPAAVSEAAASESHLADTDLPAADAGQDIFYPSTGLFIARDGHFCLAVKAGDNDDSHNHNDTGSFILYKDGRPLFIDLGVESYTQKTFSDRRYEIWTMQSAWHNLPTIGGVMQAAGPQYAAAGVTYRQNASLQEAPSAASHSAVPLTAVPDEPQGKTAAAVKSEISMDIAPAYPDSRICSYIRTAALEKNRQVVIRDAWRLTEPMPVVLSLLTCERPSLCPSQDMEIKIGALAVCGIKGAGQIQMEEIPITDPRLARAWPKSVYRILITAAGDSMELRIV